MLAGAFSANAGEDLDAGIKVGGGYSFNNGSVKYDNKDVAVESGMPLRVGAFVSYYFIPGIGVKVAPSFRMYVGGPAYKIVTDESENHIEKMGVDVDILATVTVFEFEDGKVYVEFGPQVLINLNTKLKEKAKGATEFTDVTNEELIKQFSSMLNAGAKVAVGVSYCNFGASLYVSSKFMNEFTPKEGSTSETVLGKYQVEAGVEFDYNLVPLITGA